MARPPDHGLTKTGTFRSWESMVRRCTKDTCREWPNYGGRGITVCTRWLKFKNFLADMGLRPEGTTIDRIDNTRGYEPGNCRWATNREQHRNKRSNRVVVLDGERMTTKDAAESLGTNYRTLLSRVRRHGNVINTST